LRTAIEVRFHQKKFRDLSEFCALAGSARMERSIDSGARNVPRMQSSVLKSWYSDAS
jgi:hypothetical protein